MFGYKLNTKSLAFYITLLSVILMLCMLSGCGTRKTANDISKSKTKEKERTETDQQSGSNSLEEDVKEKADTNENNNNIVTTENTKKYDANGKLIEEHTKTIVDKSIHKSTSSRKSRKSIKKQEWLNIKTTTYRLQIITTKEKRKVVEADKSIATNFGGSWVFLLAVVIISGVTFLYFYLKKR